LTKRKILEDRILERFPLETKKIGKRRTAAIFIALFAALVILLKSAF